MPPLPPSSKKTPKSTALTDAGDHRKRRRNRTTQSCLNCHTTKRMCDRKRPCSRCSQLGLSGNCVYEVDNPNRDSQHDESSRLTNRIAELEGVIRELKNKPHPRWLVEQDRPSTPSDGTHPSPLSSGGPSTPSAPVWTFPSSSSYTPGLPFSPYVSGLPPSYGGDSLDSLFSTYTGLTEHMSINRGGTCGCLNEATCYSVVLELSIRLRKAADILARSPSHSMNSACALNRFVSELDAFVKNCLLNVPSRSIGGSSLAGREKQPATPPTMFDPHYVNDTTLSWDFVDFSANNDDLMSWVPARGTR